MAHTYMPVCVSREQGTLSFSGLEKGLLAAICWPTGEILPASWPAKTFQLDVFFARLFAQAFPAFPVPSNRIGCLLSDYVY